jgi:hypothetical protein
VLSPEDRALFTFAPDTILQRSQSSAKNDMDDDDSNELTLLHGSPSKKDFLDKVKQLREKDEPEIRISTDHDLQTYTSTPIVKQNPKPIEPESIVSIRYQLQRDASFLS